MAVWNATVQVHLARLILHRGRHLPELRGRFWPNLKVDEWLRRGPFSSA
jgi:hypothetical protein